MEHALPSVGSSIGHGAMVPPPAPVDVALALVPLVPLVALVPLDAADVAIDIVHCEGDVTEARAIGGRFALNDDVVVSIDLERRSIGPMSRQSKMHASEMRARDARRALEPLAALIARRRDGLAREDAGVE